MAILPVMQSATGAGFNTTITIAPTTGTIPAGTVISAWLSFIGTGANAAITFTNNRGLVFALVARSTKADNSATVALYTAVVASSFSTSSFTFSIASGSSGSIAISMEGFTGADNTTPIAGFALATGSGATSTAPTFSSGAEEYAILSYHNGTPSQPTTGPLPTGMTVPPISGATLLGGSWGGFGAQIIFFYSTAHLSGTIAAQPVTWPLSGTWTAAAFTLKLADPTQHFVETLSETVGSGVPESLAVVFSPGGAGGGGWAGGGGGGGIGGDGGALDTGPGGPVADVRLVWADGTIDMAIADDDIASDPGIRTSAQLSLFADRRANDDDVLPAAGDDDRRGWWGDEFADVEGDLIGSRLWLLDRSAKRADVVKRAEEFIREALAWMLEDRVTDRIDVDVATTGAALVVTIGINRPHADPVRFKFTHVWTAAATEILLP